MSSRSAGQKRAALTSPNNFDAPSSSMSLSLSSLEDLLINNNVWRDSLLPYFDPIDLIRLMQTSKSTRRMAAPLLNKFENETSQTFHTEMFRSFLRNPRITKSNKTWEELTTDAARASMTGPLRLYHIKEKAADIEKRFAIMKYKKSYDKEDSLVVLFDEKGAYIGYYIFSSEQFYEDYSTRSVMFMEGRNEGGRNTSMPKMTLLCTAEDQWTGPWQAQTDYMWNEGWGGIVDRKLPVHIMCLYF